MLVAAVPSSLAASQALRPRVVAGGVEFAIRAPQARLVTIAGDFNGWSTGSLALVDPDGDGVWTLTVPLRPGRHQYLFFVDGQASFFGGRVESGRAKVFGSHRPRDRELHWLLSVHAVEVLPDGGLREAPADPVSFSMLQAQETRFVDFGDVDPAAYVQARAASEEAIGRDPGNGWLSLQRLRLEASFRRAAEQERWKGRLVAQELELSCAALLDSPLLTWAEKARARAAFRWMRRGEMLGQGFEELAELSLAARARSELAGLKGAAVREQPLARFALMAATAEAEPLDEAPEFAAWRDVAGLQAAAAGGSTTAVLALCQSLAQLRSSGSEAAGLASLAGWLQRHGLAGPVSALRLPLFPRQLGETQLLELLERFEPRTALHRDLLFWIVSSTPRLRTEPRADGWLARHLAAETDPLIAGRLAVRLGYARLLAHREDEYYALLGERLRSDPSELELLLDFESFLRSLDAIGLEFHGLLANPWRAGFARALRALEPAARTNPVLLRMLAAEMIAGGELDGAAERLCRALETCPWDAGSALLLASVLRRKGTPDAALAALRACWTARPGDRELARELGRTLALETGREPLRGLLTGRFARSELAVQALQGAVEGLRTAGSPEVALAFLRGLELPDPSAAAASRRALLRLLLEGPSSVAREKEAEDLLAGATRTAPGEAAVAAPGEAASLWRRYAWLAARAHGKGELAERWARVAIRDAGGNRVWLLDAMTELRVPPEPGAALWAAEQGLAAPGDVAPFLRFLIRRALDERQPGRAAVYLSRLESLVCLPEEARSLLAGLAFCELQSGSPVGTVRAFARLAGTGPGAAAFLLAMLLLPPAALALLVWWGRRFRV
jgi:hypothetical protein